MLKTKRRALLGVLLAFVVSFSGLGQTSAATGAITLTLPNNNTNYINNMPLTYTLTDTPLVGTVQVTLAGSTTYTITLGDTTSGFKSTTIILGNVMASANVSSISPAVSAIPDGIYSVTMSYRNSVGDPPATSVTKTNVRLDQSAPILQTLTPANGANGVSATTTLKLLFNENTQKGSGNILIKRLSDDTTVETIAVSSGQVTGQNTTTITIAPSVTLAGGETYYVIIPSTAFRDPYTHSFAGFSTSSEWQFTVEEDDPGSTPDPDAETTITTSSSNTPTARAPNTGFAQSDSLVTVLVSLGFALLGMSFLTLGVIVALPRVLKSDSNQF